jgi:ApaG protein
VISEEDGKEQEVRGQGVVGEQPTLQPGEGFDYVSGVAINSPVGTMRGSYQFIADDGTTFDAEIDQFVLSVPRILH